MSNITQCKEIVELTMTYLERKDELSKEERRIILNTLQMLKTKNCGCNNEPIR